MVHVDHLGPFETSLSQNKYLLLFVDNLTKDVQLYPTRCTDAAGIIRAVTKLCEERGLPERIISDRGSGFTSQSFQEYCRLRGIQHTLNSSRHSQANGQVERVNRTILPLLAISTQDQQRWDTKLPEIQRHLNTAYNKSTRKTPFEALHGYQPRFHGGTIRQLCQTGNEWVDPALQQAAVRDNISLSNSRAKLVYDKSHYDRMKFDLGEVVVMLKAPTPGERTTHPRNLFHNQKV